MLDSDIDTRHPDRHQNGSNSMDPPGGEKRSNLPVRGRQWVRESRIADVDGDVVLVGHGGSMKGLLVALLDLPDNAMESFEIFNCSVTTVTMESGINRLTTLNHTAHLTTANGA
jgi:broad specificity phosphatase PhoE